MSNPDFLNRAIQTVTKAVELDTAGNYQEAYKLYTNACKTRRMALGGGYGEHTC
jgi:vacuolar protein-sorting-associated protein 4